MSWFGQEATDELLREFLRPRSSVRSVQVEKVTKQCAFFCRVTAASIRIKTRKVPSNYACHFAHELRLARFANTADLLTTKDVIVCILFPLLANYLRIN